MDTPYVENNIFLRKTSGTLPKSPLRYPGGKARAVDLILKLIPDSETTLISPFFGGGSVEIAAASLGMRVIGHDIFDPLVDFWTELLLNPGRLADAVQTFFPLPKEQFYLLQKATPSDRINSAAIFYVLNRSSFGGSTLSGGMSPGHPRFTKTSIEYLRKFNVTNIEVTKKDFHQTVMEQDNTLLYLDPPYLIKNTLYGKNGNTHKDFDHEGLHNLLMKRGKWILSYNDCREIIEMFGKYRTLRPEWKYGMSKDKGSRELLILSNDLPEIRTTPHRIQEGFFGKW